MRDAGHPAGEAHIAIARVDLAPGHCTHGAHHPFAGGTLLPVDHRAVDTQKVHVGGNPLGPGHITHDNQRWPAGANTLPDLTPVRRAPIPSEHAPGSTTFPLTTPGATPNGVSSAGIHSDPGHRRCDTQGRSAGADRHNALLRFHAETLDDLERVRIATSNRLRALTAEPVNDDDTALGLSGTPTEAHLRAMLDALTKLEHQATLELQRTMRSHPLGAWVRATVGVGEKQAARLLAALGDPAARPNPAKLWQYAGHGDPVRSKMRKGQPVEHSPTAKMRTRLIADSCIKHANSPYRSVYDRERAKWADRDTTDLHKHNHALRVVGKAMLLDLWRASRREQVVA